MGDILTKKVPAPAVNKKTVGNHETVFFFSKNELHEVAKGGNRQNFAASQRFGKEKLLHC